MFAYGVWQDVLDLVRGLDKDGFTRLLINWYRRAKGKYKVPTFAHQELDLHKVFWEVQDKGGYDQVTNLKLWKVGHPVFCLELVTQSWLHESSALPCV